MSKQWQIRRGTTAENNEFTGAQGELTMDTDKNQIRLHDGITQGGVGFVDLVVEFQAPTAANNYTWYRKYKSGWVEQGGTIVVGSSNQQYTISLPCAMATTEYTLLRNSKNTGVSDYGSYIAGYTNKTTTNFSFYAVGSYGQQDWCVYGMAAQ